MSRKYFIGVICCLFFSALQAQSYKANFIKALNARDMAKAESILKAWDFADSNDPELYISYFNFYTVKSMDNATLEKSGFESKYIKEALAYISEGIMRFPTRFDMRVAKIYTLGILSDYQAYISETISMIEQSAKINNNWKGEGFTIVDKPEEIFLDAVIANQSFLFSKKDPALYKDILQISDLMLKYYPNHVQSRLNKSTVYVEQKEYDKSIEELKKAIAIEPTNAILLFNIAYVYDQKGDKVNAKKCFELVVKICNEDEKELKEAAQTALKNL